MARTLSFDKAGKSHQRSSKPDGYESLGLDILSDLRGTAAELDSDLGTFGEVRVSGAVREFFVFPKGNGTPETRKKIIFRLVEYLYKLGGAGDEKVAQLILQSLVGKDSGGERQWGETLGGAVANVPLHSGEEGHRKVICLADKQPGPRLPQLASVLNSHTAEDTMRLLRYYGLSDEKARHLRASAVLGLSSEYSVKKLEKELDGCESPRGFVKEEKITFTK